MSIEPYLNSELPNLHRPRNSAIKLLSKTKLLLQLYVHNTEFASDLNNGQISLRKPNLDFNPL